jgi:hypothetical protein
MWICKHIPKFQRGILPPPTTLKIVTVCSSEMTVPACKSTLPKRPMRTKKHLLGTHITNAVPGEKKCVLVIVMTH